jgi:hypothetical protein
MTDENDKSEDNTFTQDSSDTNERIKAMMESFQSDDISMSDIKSVLGELGGSDISLGDLGSMFENFQSGSGDDIQSMMDNLQNMTDKMGDMNGFMNNFQDKTDISGSKQNENPIDNLRKIIFDFTNDLLTSFPELRETLDSNLLAVIENDETPETELLAVRDYCLKIYPEKFFEILYQNEKLFEGDEPIYLLPNIDFAYIWKENISDSTRKTIWKYLQLLLFALVSDMSDTTSFGDTAKLFEAIDNDAFKTKLQETIFNMDNAFDSSDSSGNASGNENELPDPEKLHDHMNKMLNGKLGNLAREIAEETASDINIDMEDESSVNDVFQKLFKNPTKLMDLVTKVGSKLDTKIKSGDLKESELLAEAAEMMQHMKDMPGMENIQNLFNKAGSDKMNVNAMQSHMKRNIHLAKQKERMRSKISKPPPPPSEINADDVDIANQAAIDLLLSEGVKFEDMEHVIFSTGDKYEKSTPNSNPDNEPKKKKKKKKKHNK